MENFSYHVPVYVVTGGVDLAGHSSELAPGQVGLFDRSTFSVATSLGNGKEFFFAQGSIGGKDWYGQPVTNSHKSAYFFGKDVQNIYLSMPQTIQNEEWVLGFNGAQSSKGLRYEEGKPIRVKFYFDGDPIYRFFGGPKEYVVSYTPPKDCTAPCTEDDCPDPIVDCLTHTQELINNINNHVELQKFGVQAKLVNTPYVAGTVNMEKYTICVCDNGDSLALQSVQSQYPALTITRTSREGSTSCYTFCQPAAGAAPAAFLQSGSVLQAVCGVCPAGSTLAAAQDVWTVRTIIPDGTDLTTLEARDSFADSVGTTYGADDAGSTFLGKDGAIGIVQIKVAPGTGLLPLNSDELAFSHEAAAVCNFAAPASVAWFADGGGISSRRTLRLNQIPRDVCDMEGDRLDDVTAILAGVQGIDIATLTVIPGVACADDYTVEQDSIDCLPEDCLTNNVTFTYDDLPSFENSSWEVVPETVTEDADRKCGIRITAGYIDPQFGNCSFAPSDFYQTQPVSFEVSLLVEDADNCDFASLPSQLQTQKGRVARQSGEYVVREVIMKTDAYQKHMRQFSESPRMRESFDMNLLGMVDRTAFYKLYYVSFAASYGDYTFRKNEQEEFTAVFAFKESDPAAITFENSILGVLAGKSGQTMHINY